MNLNVLNKSKSSLSGRYHSRHYKVLFTFFIIFISTACLHAHDGLFVKFSLGPGYTLENSSINESGFTIATKNHSIGWGFNKKYALYLGEFGGLIKLKVGDYNFINLDAFGLGFTFNTPFNIHVSLSGAYGKVSFARKWYEPEGDDGGNGYALNINAEKEWLLAKRWGFRIGPQAFFLKTTKTDYRFMNISLNCSIVFYFTPVR